jgi:transglutaminase-like putative cysteine protease
MAIKLLRNQNILVLLLLIVFLIACQPVTNSKDAVSELQSDDSTQTIDEQTNASNDNYDQELLNPSLNILDSVEYRLQQNIKVVNHGPGSPSKQNLWVALISDDAPYQEVLEREIFPSSYQIVIDEYGNEIAEFDFSEMPPDSEIQVKIDYRVKVNQIAADLSPCLGELPNFYTDAELHIESENPQIISLSRDLAKDTQSICDQVRAFYDYIGQELVYSYNGGNWGAQAALGAMGADCTEYSSLMIALSRAAGIPARYIEGLSFTPEGDEVLARQEHAWLEVYLPGVGWTPMDPTMGRSPVNRDKYFGRLPADHIIVSRGRNPSTLRGASYWTYIYWPGNSAEIKIEEGKWNIVQLND